MNIDESKIEIAITNRTRAIVVVHYAGVACEMNAIMAIANKHNIMVVEDAAQGVMSKYENRYLGTIGHLGCFSFHETKNYQCGEGGAILINDERFIARAEIIREKGTNRSRFFRGQIDKYTWIDIGSSYLLSEINAAFLYAQLEQSGAINDRRLEIWGRYYRLMMPLADSGRIVLPVIPRGCTHNAHMFYVKVRDIEQRTALISYLKSNSVMSLFHYVPLHSSPAGQTYGQFSGEDDYTTIESERLVRLPLFYSMTDEMVDTTVKIVFDFFGAGSVAS